jgi:hypothetical protein
MIRLVEEGVLQALGEESLFNGGVAEDVGAVISATIRYVARRLDAPKTFMRAGFSEETVVEQHLADDYEDWLHGLPLARGSISIEVQRIGGGRVDVLIAFGTHRVVVELKRELPTRRGTAWRRTMEPRRPAIRRRTTRLGLYWSWI